MSELKTEISDLQIFKDFYLIENSLTKFNKVRMLRRRNYINLWKCYARFDCDVSSGNKRLKALCFLTKTYLKKKKEVGCILKQVQNSQILFLLASSTEPEPLLREIWYYGSDCDLSLWSQAFLFRLCAYLHVKASFFRVIWRLLITSDFSHTQSRLYEWRGGKNINILTAKSSHDAAFNKGRQMIVSCTNE